MQHPQGEERENIPTDTMDKRDTVSVTPITKKKKWKWDRERRSSYRKGLLCSSYTLCQRIRAGTVKYRLDFFRATCPAWLTEKQAGRKHTACVTSICSAFRAYTTANASPAGNTAAVHSLPHWPGPNSEHLQRAMWGFHWPEQHRGREFLLS